MWLEGLHDAVFQHVRFRGSAGDDDFRAVAFGSGAHHIVLDHISSTWASDQMLIVWGDNINDVTIQWSIFAEGRPHNAAGHFSGGCPHERMTLHHNYIAHTSYRNHLVDTGRYNFINNVNYNTINWDYHFRQGYKCGQVSPDVINQYFKEGPDSSRKPAFDLVVATEAGSGPYGSPLSIYLEGNKYVDRNENTVYNVNDQWSMAAARSLAGQPLPTY